MINLLKYDIKRNLTNLISVAVIMIALQVIVTITGISRDWQEAIVVMLNLMIYGVACLLIFIMLFKTYRDNIKSYSRRLIPLQSVSHIISPLLLGLICFVVVMAMIVLHAILFQQYFDFHNKVFKVVDLFPDLYLVIFQLIWWYIFAFASLILPTTIGVSIRGKKGNWIGLASFFVIQGFLDWFQTKILGFTNGVGLGGLNMIVVGEMGNTSTSDITILNNGTFGIDYKSFLVQIVFIVLSLWAATLLLKHREQV